MRRENTDLAGFAIVVSERRALLLLAELSFGLGELLIFLLLELLSTKSHHGHGEGLLELMTCSHFILIFIELKLDNVKYLLITCIASTSEQGIVNG